MLGEIKNQFSLTRAVLGTGGRAKSKFLLLVLGLLVLLAALYLLPVFSRPDALIVSKLPALTLINDIKEWKLKGLPESFVFSNQVRTSTAIRTNLQTASGTIVAVMKLESAAFKGEGVLFGTEDYRVFWHGRDRTTIQVPVTNVSGFHRTAP